MWQLALVLSALSLQPATADEFRLPGGVRPAHYDLRLLYDMDKDNNFPFFGVVHILLSASVPTTKIVLHGSREFTISDDEDGIVLSGPPSSSKVVTAMFDEKHGFLTLQLDRAMEQNREHTLKIKFYGNVKRGMSGTYINSYVDSRSGIEEYLISTQFEPNAARKVFPCFDEPAYKATFNVTIGHQRGFTAISNMPLLRNSDVNSFIRHWSLDIIEDKFRKDMSEFTWSEFQKTVVMSTYLVAFVVSKLAYVVSPSGHSTMVKIWARRDVIAQTSYAGEIGPRLLKYYENYFGIKYPLPKVDMVAIPGDQVFSGMENWGLITFAERILLNDPQQPVDSCKKTTALTVAHEIAHFWFSNLVTMKWWSEVWLKEGMVSFLATFGADEMEPCCWNTSMSNFLANSVIVKKQDALESTRPITAQLEDPSNIMENYNPISYGKAQIVLRMLYMILGDAFKTGLHNYLAKYSYKSTDRDDLWREFTFASRAHEQAMNVTVKQVMDSWVTQAGYPLLTVTRDYDDSTLSVSQKRYLSRSGDSGRSSWWIPLRVLSQPDVDNRREAIIWLAEGEGTTSPLHFAHYSGPDEWVIFNYDMIALYRVNYDDRNWKLLSATLNSDNYTQVPMLGRVQLVSDALALAWTNHVDYSLALELVVYLRREKEQLALNIGLGHLWEVGRLLRRSHYDVFNNFMASIIRDHNSVADIFRDSRKNNPSEADFRRKGIPPEFSAFAILKHLQESPSKPELLTFNPGPCWQSMGIYMRDRLETEDSHQSSDSVPGVLRSTLLTAKDEKEMDTWVCDVLPDCRKKAVQMFNQWMSVKDPDKENPIRKSLYSTVYIIAISQGEEKEWRFLYDRLRNTADVYQRAAIMGALVETPVTALHNEYLEALFAEGSKFSATECEGVVSAMLISRHGYPSAKEFLYKRFVDVNKRFASSPEFVAKIYSNLVSEFTSQQEIDEFVRWREKHSFARESLVVRQALDAAAGNAEWVARHQSTVVEKMKELTGKEEEKAKERKKLKILRGGVDARGPAALLIVTCTTTVLTRLASFCL